MAEATQDPGTAQVTRPPKPEAAPTCAITCPQPNDTVAPTFSPNGTGPAGGTVTCRVIYNGGDMYTQQGQVDNSANWQVQFNNLPLTGSDQGHMTTVIGASFTDSTGTLACSVPAFPITIATGGETC